MIIIAIISMILIFCTMCITSNACTLLEKVIKKQDEIIKVLKNK